ncbi:MAG: phosphoribosylformylglycinamidine synthase subunit PurL [Candidatus Beckwithbacteria bacterium]|nr:phosphoribosylformylglycinamidine synthase subunit PurL [Candidatus Beckwithbacteria bacterium]
MVRQIFVIDKQNQVLVQVYKIDKNLSAKDCQKVGERLINPVIQEFEVDKLGLLKRSKWWAEISFLPGVTDNVATTSQEIISDLLKIKFTNRERVYTSQLIFNKKKLEEISANPLIQKVTINQRQETPRVKLSGKKTVEKVNLEVSDNQLEILGKQGIKNRGPLALDLNELRTIREYFRQEERLPTDIELEAIAQTWSEHCQHKIFKDLFKKYIKAATDKINKRFCVSVFTDNSGAIELDKDWLVTHKVETHNSPSALDPFGGAITGIVGVNRDTIGFGLGAKPVANIYGFCLAEPDDKRQFYRDQKLTRPLLSARRIFDGVVKGVNSGGNCSGIPTPLGWLYFDDSYRGKPLVFVGTVGVIPKKKGKRWLYQKKAKVDDYIVMVGGRVGLDGIHGATFSSESLNRGSPASAVQIGDPITQKKLSDALVKEARDQNLYNSITDNGAGGLSCSVAEMAKETNGFEVELTKVPVKYSGLAPWQIWISESQERMTLAVPKNKWRKFKKLMEKRGVEATVIGRFTNSSRGIVKYQGKKIMDLDIKWLHDGWPKKQLNPVYVKNKFKEPKLVAKKDLTQTLLKMLRQPNLSSFEFISRQYDHEVQGGSVIKPLQGKGKINAEAVVVRPILSSSKGVVLSAGINPRLSLIDPYQMAGNAIDAAVRNAVSVGANFDKIALLDNFCWCSSDEAQKQGELKRAVEACYDVAVIYQTPFISGKDSMFNDFSGFDKNGQSVKISILPTLLISSIGIIDDITKAVSIDFKFPGDLIYILGETKNELGGSEYFKMRGYVGNNLPKVETDKNKRLYQALATAIHRRLVASSISINRGGLGIALTKSAMASDLGLKIKLTNDGYSLFSESSGGVVVTINPKNKLMFEKIMDGNFYQLVGKVTHQPQILIGDFVKVSVARALQAYKLRFKNF